jgi:hypothetical protein
MCELTDQLDALHGAIRNLRAERSAAFPRFGLAQESPAARSTAGSDHHAPGGHDARVAAAGGGGAASGCGCGPDARCAACRAGPSATRF